MNLFVWGISTYSGIPGVRSELTVYSVNRWIRCSRWLFELFLYSSISFSFSHWVIIPRLCLDLLWSPYKHSGAQKWWARTSSTCDIFIFFKGHKRSSGFPSFKGTEMKIFNPRLFDFTWHLSDSREFIVRSPYPHVRLFLYMGSSKIVYVDSLICTVNGVQKWHTGSIWFCLVFFLSIYFILFLFFSFQCFPFPRSLWLEGDYCHVRMQECQGTYLVDTRTRNHLWSRPSVSKWI